MINFFRKIRRKFADNNQFFKYSRYAIGEIVLVVIGILIALGINNWNNERIANLKMTSYLQDISEDLKIDTLEFNFYIGFYEKYLDNRKRLLSLTEYYDISTDSLSEIINLRQGVYVINSTTFTKITNLGLSEISKNDSLSRKIYEYYTIKLMLFNDIMNWEKRSTETESNYWNYQGEYEINFFNEFHQFQDQRANRKNLIKIIKSPKGRNYLLSDYDRKQRVLSIYRRSKDRADSILREITIELNSEL